MEHRLPGKTLPLPDTPYFRCRKRHIDPQSQRELESALSGGVGSPLVNRYLNFGRIAGPAVSFSISWLAQKSRTTRGDVLKHLRRLCAQGFLGPDVLDEDYGFVYLTQEAKNDRFVEYTIDARGYEVVRANGDWYRARLHVAAPSADTSVTAPTARSADTPATAPAAPSSAAERAAEKSVTRFTELIRAYNKALPDKDITEALDETESLLVLVADTVKNMPAQDHKLGVVSTRYLQPLEKLLTSYQRLYRFGNASNKASRIRAQIIDAVHLFNAALRQLTEDLLADAEFEISSDINVLRMMLERDGLLGTPFQ